MERIYTIIQREKMCRVRDEILAVLDKKKEASAEENSTFRNQEILNGLNEILRDLEKGAEPDREGWDFSREKTAPDFVRDNVLHLRPFFEEDEKFYASVREQYSIYHKNLSEEELVSYWRHDLRKASSFSCLIEAADSGTKLGYIAVKDTAKELWEIAIELDQAFCGQGYGPRAAVLFLSRLKEITGKNQFQFLVEVDNLPCQSCMKKVGAELVGIHNFAFDCEEDARQFEETHLHLITEHICVLAKQLGVTPRKLLSHVLDYRLSLF